jgi:hypothetical protein
MAATASQPRPDLFAHREALRLPATAVVAKLVEIVGHKLTAYIGGVKDARAVTAGSLVAKFTETPKPASDLPFRWCAL